MDVRPLAAADIPAAEALLDDVVAGRRQTRLGETHDVLALSGWCAWDHGRLAGAVTWSGASSDGSAELAVLAVTRESQGRGVGAALVETVADAATSAWMRTLWLVTTNDNLDALRLYQRHGFRLAALRPGTIDEARSAGAAIPHQGAYGIPLRDELVLERTL